VLQAAADAVPGKVRAAYSDDLVERFDLDALARRSFPSAELVGTAASLLEPVARTDVGELGQIDEGPSYELVTWPGGIQARKRDYARAERSHERRVDHHRKLIDEQAAAPATDEKPPTRGKITSWSAKSRSNMRAKIAKLDFEPLFEHAPLAAMVTLTYPGDWLVCAPDRETSKAHVEAFKMRYFRAWGHKIRGLWKLEFQGRGAPHYHLLICPPRGGSHPEGLPFRQWLSRTWTHIVDPPDDEEARRHLLAGTGVDWSEGLKATDPRRVTAYFAKHGVLSGKEYQHRVPAEWLAAGGSGRWWGVWGLKEATAAVSVQHEAWVATQRVLRRLSASKAYTRVETVDRVEQATGRIRRRKVRRKVHTLKGRGGGMYLVLNDGPNTMAKIATWLPTVVESAPALVPPTEDEQQWHRWDRWVINRDLTHDQNRRSRRARLALELEQARTAPPAEPAPAPVITEHLLW
jgi:hypothetical protein